MYRNWQVFILVLIFALLWVLLWHALLFRAELWQLKIAGLVISFATQQISDCDLLQHCHMSLLIIRASHTRASDV